MDQSWRLRIERNHRLEDLLDGDQVNQYIQRTRTPCSVVSLDGEWIGRPPSGNPCRVLSAARGGDIACANCMPSHFAEALKTTGSVVCKCQFDVLQHIAAIRVFGRAVAFVCGPVFRFEPLPEAQLAALRAACAELSIVARADVVHLQDDVTSLAAQLGRRCASERGLYLLNQAVQSLSSLISESDTWNTLLDATEVLFDSPTVCGYRLESDGKLHIWGYRGILESDAGEGIYLGSGDAGVAAFDRKTRWDEKSGLVAVPMLTGVNSVVGVITVSSSDPHKISRTGRQTIEILANCAALAIERARSESATRSTIPSIFGSRSVGIADALFERKIEDGVDRTGAQRDLFQALADQACSMTPNSRSNVRTYNRVAGELRTVAFQGQGWTETIRNEIFRTSEFSGAAYAVNARTHQLVTDVTKEKHYKAVFPDTRTQFSIPIFLRKDVFAVLVIQSSLPDAFTTDLQDTLLACVKQYEDVLEGYYRVQEGWLYELEKQIRDERDIGALCSASVAHIRKILGVRASSIFLLNRAGAVLELAASTSLRSIAPDQNRNYEIGEGLTGWVAKTGKTLRLSDAADERERLAVAKDLHWKQKHVEDIEYDDALGHWTFLAAPLQIGGRIIGVVRATIKKNKADFDAADESLIVRIANLLATVINGIRSTEESERRIDRLGSLVDFSKRLSTTLDVKTICRTILEEVRGITGCVVSHLRVFDSATDLLILEWAEGPYKDRVPVARKVGEGVAGYVAAVQEPLYQRAVSEDSRWQSAAAEVAGGKDTPWVVSGACLPLIADGALVGTLLLEWSREVDFDSDYQIHLNELAGRCASAVKTALAYRDKVASLTRIRRIGMQFTSVRSFELVLQEVLNAVLEEAGIDFGVIRLLDKVRNKWVLRAARSRDNLNLQELLIRDIEVSNDVLGEALKSSAAIYLEDAQTDKRFQCLLESQTGSELSFLRNIRSLVVLPIWHRGCLGFVSLVSSGKASGIRLNPSRIEFLEILATYAAYAIENARATEEELLREPLEVMGAMVGGVLHDIKTPLQHMLSAVELIEDRSAGLPPEHTDLLKEKIQEIEAVCHKLRRFSTIEPMELLDIKEMLVRTTERFALDATDQDVAVKLLMDKDLPPIRANEDQLEEVARLLLLNALEATPAGGRIEILAEATAERVVLSFVDTGEGMPPEVLAQCTIPAFTTKNVEAGTARGLGLPVVSSIVRHHGGELRIESEPGRGTQVRIYLLREEANLANSTGC